MQRAKLIISRPRQTISLNDRSWHFGQVPRCSFTDVEIFDLPQVTEWLPATVPGNVRTDLLALGRIPDPFWAEDYKESLWVEDVDWWYRRTIETDPPSPTQRAFLIFEGIDYLSAIFVNGREMTRREGMFSRQMVEITDALTQGAAEVAVRLWGSGALPRRHLNLWQRLWQKIAASLYDTWAGVYPDRSATLKGQMSFGWDFAPPIRTTGIWDEVRLVTSGPVFIAEASATGQPLDPSTLPPKATHAPAKISVMLTLDADQPRPVEVAVQTSPANFEGLSFNPVYFSLALPAGASKHQLEFELPWVGLWQPWDRGQPRLYNLHITVSELDGQPLDEMTIRAGIRHLEVKRWNFKINGQSEFIRGLNWVPADCFPGRLHRERYSDLLTQARESGANLLRVWGGGLREKQAFYDLCDEMGLLVWQEFPFACMFLGSYPRHPAYLALVEAECSAIVRQLRHHPSVAVWCGGNEFSRWRNRPLLTTLAGVTRRDDPGCPFIPVSPSFDHGGDSHNWDVWHGHAPIRAYQVESAAFLSEFGLQSLPDLDTLTAMLPDPSSGWDTHHADLPKLTRYMSSFTPVTSFSVSQDVQRRDAKSQNREEQTIKDFIVASQRAQAIALQTAIEHLRRRKGEAGGLCVWQFNEPWPAISWAIVDYFGRSKLAYRQLKQWYQPVLISLKFPVGRRWEKGDTFKAEIWGINDELQHLKSCDLRVELNEKPLLRQIFDLPANSVQYLGTLAHPLTCPPGYINLILRQGDKIVSQNSYDLAWSDEGKWSFKQHLRRVVANWVVR